MFCSHRRLLTALALILCAGCVRRQPEPVQRLAITRFENFSADPNTDWIGRALAEVVTAELSASRSIYPIPSQRLHALNAAFGARPIQAPGISAETPLAEAAGANRIGHGEYAIVGGRLRVRLTIEDPRTRTLPQRPIEAVAEARDVVGAATAIARGISTDAGSYPTSNPVALEALVRGLESGVPATVRQFAERAIAADPNFGPAYLMLAESALQQQDRAAAEAVMRAAGARGPAIDEVSRIRLEIMVATLRGDGAAAERAIGALTQARPLDPMTWRLLGETAAGRRQYQQTVAAYSRALSIEPEDAALWNQLGYSAAYAGDLDQALSALRNYQNLRPSDLNPIDSMGDVNLLSGRLKDAESLYLEVYKKNPAFLNGIDLFKAAMARLMTGDVAGADAILGEKAANPEWQWLAGRRQQAIAAMAADAAKQSSQEVRVRQYCMMAVWSALENDRNAAAKYGSQAAVLATPSTGGTVAVARFVTLPSASADEWVGRARQMFGNAPALGEAALGYALLLDRHFADAVPVLQRLEARVPGTGDRSAAIKLAWALIETGKVAEAAPLLRMNPIPGTDNATAFIGLYFPRLYQLRAIVAEREGKADEARENRRIYAALGGR